MHGRRGAHVGYYRTVTGPGREELHEDPRTGSTLRVLRVERLVEFVTCSECWTRPAVQAQLKGLRRSGLVAED